VLEHLDDGLRDERLLARRLDELALSQDVLAPGLADGEAPLEHLEHLLVRLELRSDQLELSKGLGELVPRQRDLRRQADRGRLVVRGRRRRAQALGVDGGPDAPPQIDLVRGLEAEADLRLVVDAVALVEATARGGVDLRIQGRALAP
jgi:hypothetical protein